MPEPQIYSVATLAVEEGIPSSDELEGRPGKSLLQVVFQILLLAMHMDIEY